MRDSSMLPAYPTVFYVGGGGGGAGRGGISISIASRVVVRLIILAFVLTTPIAWSSIYC